MSEHPCSRCGATLRYREQNLECYDVDGHEVQEDVETWECPSCGHEQYR